MRLAEPVKNSQPAAAADATAAEPAAAYMDPLTSLAQSYNNKEKSAPDVHDQLAGIITTLCQKRLPDDVINGKLAAYVHLSNCPILTVTRVNSEIWSKLSSVTRSRDIKIQQITNVITQSMVAIASVAENIVTATRSDEALSKSKMATALTALVEGLALMSIANRDFNQRHREDQFRDFNAEFRGLCSAAPDDNSQLL